MSTRRIWAVFHHDSKLLDRAMTIDTRGSVIAHVERQLNSAERVELIGVLNASKTAWID